MSGREPSREHRPADPGAELAGTRWALLIVHDILLGATLFGQIRQHLGIASNVLAQHLTYLADCGIVARTARSEHSRRFAYHLTAKGQDLAPVLAALCGWGPAHAAQAGPGPSGGAGQAQALAPMASCRLCREAGRMAALAHHPLF